MVVELYQEEVYGEEFVGGFRVGDKGEGKGMGGKQVGGESGMMEGVKASVKQVARPKHENRHDMMNRDACDTFVCVLSTWLCG